MVGRVVAGHSGAHRGEPHREHVAGLVLACFALLRPHMAVRLLCESAIDPGRKLAAYRRGAHAGRTVLLCRDDCLWTWLVPAARPYPGFCGSYRNGLGLRVPRDAQAPSGTGSNRDKNQSFCAATCPNKSSARRGSERTIDRKARGTIGPLFSSVIQHSPWSARSALIFRSLGGLRT